MASTGGSTVSEILSRRRSLKVAVASLCNEAGFGSARDSALETLTEIMQSFMTELAQSAQGYCELAGRTEPLPSDVIMALVDMGVNVDSIPNYARRRNRTEGVGRSLRSLNDARYIDRRPHLGHGTIKTHKQPGNEYQVVREKAASQKRDVERALTRFIAKTGQVQSVLRDDVNAFPLISVKPEPLPYLTALMPDEQDMVEPSVTPTTQQSALDANTETETIDNPYIRPVKMPRTMPKRT